MRIVFMIWLNFKLTHFNLKNTHENKYWFNIIYYLCRRAFIICAGKLTVLVTFFDIIGIAWERAKKG